MEFLNIFAMIGMMIDDFMAIISLIGSIILFLGSFSNAPLKRYGKIAEWSIAGLIFGCFFQISMLVTGTTPEKVGVFFQMAPTLVNGLLTLSFLLLVGRWWVRRNRYRFQQ